MGIKDSRLYKSIKPLVSYAVFGALTTVINIAIYWLCYEGLGWQNVPSNIIAWILAVAFAFVTNKLWVFESKSLEREVVLAELWKFVAARLSTGAIDLVTMWVGVDLMHGPAVLLKILANVIVITLNYILSKLVVFKDR